MLARGLCLCLEAQGPSLGPPVPKAPAHTKTSLSQTCPLVVPAPCPPSPEATELPGAGPLSRPPLCTWGVLAPVMLPHPHPLLHPSTPQGGLELQAGWAEPRTHAGFCSLRGTWEGLQQEAVAAIGGKWGNDTRFTCKGEDAADTMQASDTPSAHPHRPRSGAFSGQVSGQ